MREKILGVEGGGTKTAWALFAGDEMIERGKLPPSNLRLTPRDQLEKILRALPAPVDRAGIFLAGCATVDDRASLQRLAATVWPGAKIVVGSDRESGLAACLEDRDGIVVNAGTGSSATGRAGDRMEKAGGWGHILGDTGGAYSLSIRALRSILREYDSSRGERNFAASILSTLTLNDFDELVRWAQTADKTEVAALAPVVFAAAEEGDPAAQQIVVEGAAALANFALAVAERLRLAAPDVVLMGGLFNHQPAYLRTLRAEVLAKLPRASITLATTPPECGAAWLVAREGNICHELAQPPVEIGATERVNPRSRELAEMNPRGLVDLFVAEEKFVGEALGAAAADLARAVEVAAKILRAGGRIFYLGAGTSGRLGVMDAAELPPTFGVSPQTVQAIIAGGAPALRRSIEGAEDDARHGAFALDERNLSARDLVIGLSASGRTPFVLGALARAHEIGAATILLHCNSQRPVAPACDLAIELDAGPEILAGSTRLKAGTATKVALNIISTGAMVLAGRTHGNRMIDLQATNEKLRQRALGMVMEITGATRDAAQARLERSNWNVRRALSEL